MLALERRQLADATVYFKSLDTTFPRLQDESLLYVHDPLINTYADRAPQRRDHPHPRYQRV